MYGSARSARERGPRPGRCCCRRAAAGRPLEPRHVGSVEARGGEGEGLGGRAPCRGAQRSPSATASPPTEARGVPSATVSTTLMTPFETPVFGLFWAVFGDGGAVNGPSVSPYPRFFAQDLLPVPSRSGPCSGTPGVALLEVERAHLRDFDPHPPILIQGVSLPWFSDERGDVSGSLVWCHGREPLLRLRPLGGVGRLGRRWEHWVQLGAARGFGA